MVSFARLVRGRAAPGLIGSVYHLPTDQPRLYPESVAGRMAEVPPTSRGFLYRKPTMLLHEYVRKFAQYQTRREALRELRNGRAGFLLTGSDGVGKSVLLAQSVQFARAAGVLTLYFPDCHRHTHGHLYLEPNPLLPGYFDTPIPTVAFFKSLRAAQPTVLKSIPFSPAVPLPIDAPEEKPPVNLLQLVDWGLAKVDRHGILLKIFLDEVLTLKDTPVLIALDGYNWFLHNTEYHFGPASLAGGKEEVPRVHAEKLVLVRQLNRLLSHAARADNVLFLAAVDTSHPSSQDTPFHPELTALHPFPVPKYSDLELRTMVDYYLKRGPYNEHYKNPKSTVLPNLERLCYKIGFMTGHTARGVWQQLVTLPHWTRP